ncbi:alpha-L-fucosidase [Flammeovirga yaeyamensis]|uniref:alpha-L-fucosidase n=1 Tax=Flammeovirga yaeyamensis TaxID=367791 RepID=A0AAX1NDL8_9BACT|nr:alpha-L-fucosidase [Flammeovirga yaeyamensis]MBB3696698.1 alpha-L-fucosidase [Flammeovirga yaeyamensis]NMF33369.1 alpha-L-fucosidase [Flammeovirga yaeyamensis]QWG05357.1 alpha-L-fucosidase [Flammeovirga yaeyamensis]
MKNVLIIIAAFFIVGCSVQRDNKQSNKEVFTADWESLQQYEVPTWFQDAKLGIFIHWGAYSVPAYGSEWYPRLMYMDSVEWTPDGEAQKIGATAINKYHESHFGTLDKFGYKDFIPMFKGENFDAQEWVQLFQDAGAKYIVPVAEHHDGFAMYKSKHTRWNSVDMGPQKDILGELTAEARKQDIKIGASSHYAFNWNYFTYKKGFDTMDPEYSDLYSKPHDHYAPASQEFLSHWWDRTVDIIDAYQPDILWFDFYIDREEFMPYHPKLAAYYYNKGIEWKKDVVLQTKNFKKVTFPEGTHVLDIERGKMSDINPKVWQTDTSIGKNSWGYVSNWETKDANTIIDDLVDIVSKNGCLLLNVGPKADGTIPDDQKAILLEIGQWLKVNGEAIYGSRPWKIYGDGPTQVATGHHTEGKNKDLTADDFRFTTKNGKLYAISMDWARNGKVKIPHLQKGSEYLTASIKDIKLLGVEEDLKWSQNEDYLEVMLPSEKPCEHAFVFEIAFDKTNNPL